MGKHLVANGPCGSVLLSFTTEVLGTMDVRLWISIKKIVYSSGCSSARQGPRTVMMIIPWRRSALLRKRSGMAVRRFGEVVGLNSCMGCLGFDGEILVVSGAAWSGRSRESLEGRKRSFRSLKAMSRRILSFSHRMARAIKARTRKMMKDTNASMFILASLFRWSGRFLLRAGNGSSHGRIGLHIFHPIIIHDA